MTDASEAQQQEPGSDLNEGATPGIIADQSLDTPVPEESAMGAPAVHEETAIECSIFVNLDHWSSKFLV